MKKSSFIIVIFLCLTMIITPVMAHPGRTDSNGCHTCRTNCESYGLSYGEYHCHGGSDSSSSSNSSSSSREYIPDSSDDNNYEWIIWLLLIGGGGGYFLYFVILALKDEYDEKQKQKNLMKQRQRERYEIETNGTTEQKVNLLESDIELYSKIKDIDKIINLSNHELYNKINIKTRDCVLSLFLDDFSFYNITQEQINLLIKTLINENNNIDIKNSTKLHEIIKKLCSYKRVDILTKIVDLQLINGKVNLLNQILATAVDIGNCELIRKTIQNGADINCSTCFDDFLFKVALRDTKLLKVLIQYENKYMSAELKQKFITCIENGEFEKLVIMVQKYYDLIKFNYMSWFDKYMDCSNYEQENKEVLDSYEQSLRDKLRDDSLSINDIKENFNYINFCYAADVLVYSIKKNDNILFKKCIASFKNKNDYNLDLTYYYTLHYFCRTDYPINDISKNYLKFIVQSLKKDKNVTDLYCDATKNGKIEIIKLLYENGFSNIPFKDKQKGLLLFKTASAPNAIEIIEYLSEKGMDIKEKDKNNENILFKAIRNKNIELVKYLLEKGFDVNVCNNKGISTLIVAVKSKNLDIIKIILEKDTRLVNDELYKLQIIDLARNSTNKVRDFIFKKLKD